MNFKLNTDLSINVSSKLVFDQIASGLGLPSDWLECKILSGNMYREVRYGPIEEPEIITQDPDLIDKLLKLQSLFKAYMDL